MLEDTDDTPRVDFMDLDALAGLAYAGEPAEQPIARYRPSRDLGHIYAHKNRPTNKNVREDFTETVYWNALLPTGPDGMRRVEFDLSDRVTTWDVRVDAHGAGRVGQSLLSFEAVPPFSMEAKLPVELIEEQLANGAFDLWERRGRELIFYWRDFAPSQRIDMHFDLIARIPGTTTGPASRVYRYYAPDQIRWAGPLALEVTPAR